MTGIEPTITQISGQTQGMGITAVMDLVYLFKGKLRAAAGTRNKFHDAVDLRWLEGYGLARLQQNRSQFDLLHIGLALRRYPELQFCFTRIGVDVKVAEARAASYDMLHPPPPQPGDVQKKDCLHHLACRDA